MGGSEPWASPGPLRAPSVAGAGASHQGSSLGIRFLGSSVLGKQGFLWHLTQAAEYTTDFMIKILCPALLNKLFQ